ncbi:MAG: hypothetical protein K0R17_803 [Rariglobus sp.]|nr:hypothetical protein [Rariglobus sp.]
MSIGDAQELRLFMTLPGIDGLGGAGHFFIEAPEGGVRVAGVGGVRRGRGRGRGAGVPAVDAPAVAWVDRLERDGTIEGRIAGEAEGGGFFDEAGEKRNGAVGVVEVASSGVGEEGDRCARMRGLEGEGGGEAVLPPFVFTHDHEGGDAVDGAIAPVNARFAVAGERGAGRVAVIGDEGEGSGGVPRGEVPGKRRARRVAEGHDGGVSEFVIAGAGGEIGDDAFEVFTGAVVEIERGVEVGHDPELGEAEPGECAAQGRVFEDALLDHVVAGDDDASHAQAIRWNPQVGTRLAVGGGPLPFGSL